MYVVIITPEKVLFEGEAAIVGLPGELGYFDVLNNHAPLISPLVKGKIKIKEPSGFVLYFEIQNGIVEVLNDEVKLLVE